MKAELEKAGYSVAVRKTEVGFPAILRAWLGDKDIVIIETASAAPMIAMPLEVFWRFTDL